MLFSCFFVFSNLGSGLQGFGASWGIHTYIFSVCVFALFKLEVLASGRGSGLHGGEGGGGGRAYAGVVFL